MAKMFYQGHGSYRLLSHNGTCVYVDPFADPFNGAGHDIPADLILVTHEHFDHTATDLMPHAQGCTVIRAADLHPALSEYLTIESHGIIVTAVQAYNENHPADECVGYVLEIDGLSFYASGDTGMTDDMTSGKLANLGLDYAVFCGDGLFNMDVKTASECARLVDARHSIPAHLMPVNGPEDAHDLSRMFSEEKADAFKVRGKVIVRPGEEIDLI